MKTSEDAAMRNYFISLICTGFMVAIATAECIAATAGKPDGDALVIAAGGQTTAVIIVSPDAEIHERQAADDLAKYIELMCGARPGVANTQQAIHAALAGKQPLLVVGQEALKAKPELGVAIDAVLKKNPYLRTDGIALRRQGNRVYLTGNNDRSHYFAVAELLRRWGCRWYFPTEFGECVPHEPELNVGELDHVYSSPFELRSYWISWLGDNTGAADFQLRNMMTSRSEMPPSGHALGQYTKGIGKGMFHFPITAPASAQHVAGQVEKMYAEGKSFSLGMEDGSYDSDNATDQKLMKLQWDKYMMRWSVTDPMLELYNNVARSLQTKHPDSHCRIGFLAYANMTLPPVRKMSAERSLFCELAPIDIDPIHGMDDPQSPPRQEYRDMLYKWAKVMQGRLCIYDYDQGMLVWRDLPNPSHQAFRQDVQHYRKAGILGMNTESRNAVGTTFLNLHIRARLLWNPDEDVDALLADFHEQFYGPASRPMSEYWDTIFKAWEDTIVTEHEYFVAPAIYTPKVLAVLQKKMAEAQQVAAELQVQGRALSRNEKQFIERIRVTAMSHAIIQGYLAMVRAAATEGDYAAAVVHGEKTLAIREQLSDTSGIFTTYRNYKVEQNGYAWWPGEVKQYRELLPFVNGSKGKLITRLPVEWAFHRDKKNHGPNKGYAAGPIDLTYWNKNKDTLTLDGRKDYPDQWEMLRTDLYAQAQGIREPDRQSYTGGLWYRTDIELTASQSAGAPHIRFPGLFNECWLYINGQEVAHRSQGKLWWLNDYRFEWDVDLAGKLQSGRNTIALRCNCEHHFGGMFRRPFLYEAAAE
jgi:Domain of unknown function (DUF4838)